MKFLTLLFILFCSSAFAQVRNGTTTEEIVASGHYDWAYLAHDDVGFCDLPMVTRGDNDYLVKHRLIVETVMDHVTETTERIDLQTDDQFEYENCNSHIQKFVSIAAEYRGNFPVTLYYMDKLIIHRGSYLGMPFCQKEQVRVINATINNARYLKVIKLSEGNCI